VREIILLDDVHKAVSAPADDLRGGSRKLQVVQGRRIALCHANLLSFFSLGLFPSYISRSFVEKEKVRKKGGDGRTEREEKRTKSAPGLNQAYCRGRPHQGVPSAGDGNDADPNYARMMFYDYM
jgi:hypothetical protein